MSFLSSRLAILSDIHANAEALAAVLHDASGRGITAFICLGDIVGYASGVNFCAKIIRELGCPTVLGNHDEAAGTGLIPEEFNDTAAAGAAYAATKLSATNREWLRSLPLVAEEQGLTCVHASLAKEKKWSYILQPEDAARHLAEQKTQLAFCGHTHRPMIWWEQAPGEVSAQTPSANHPLPLPLAGKVLVNVGAVGQPRDGDPRACYVIYEPSQSLLEFRRVAYDFKATHRKILRAKLPRFSAQRLALGR